MHLCKLSFISTVKQIYFWRISQISTSVWLQAWYMMKNQATGVQARIDFLFFIFFGFVLSCSQPHIFQEIKKWKLRHELISQTVLFCFVPFCWIWTRVPYQIRQIHPAPCSPVSHLVIFLCRRHPALTHTFNEPLQINGAGENYKWRSITDERERLQRSMISSHKTKSCVWWQFKGRNIDVWENWRQTVSKRWV